MRSHQRNRPIRALIVSNSLGEGGAERFTSSLIMNLNRDRVEPSLCLLRGPVDYPLPPNLNPTILEKNRPWHIPRTIFRLRRLIAKQQPDVVISTIANANLLTGLALASGDLHTKWIARIGNDPAKEPVWQRRMLGNRYRDADYVVANSRGLAEGFRQYYSIDAALLKVIRNPVDFDRICSLGAAPIWTELESDSHVIMSVGRLSRQKRPDRLIEAFARVRREIPATLWICGDGPLAEDTRSRISRYGLQDSVRMLGFQENPFAYMHRASLFVLTSDHEGLPNALIEAQGLGLPAVSTRCEFGPDEIIEEGVTGRLTPTGDVAALATAMIELLGDEKGRREFSVSARRRARETFDVHELTRAWEDLCLNLAIPGRSDPLIVTPNSIYQATANQV